MTVDSKLWQELVEPIPARRDQLLEILHAIQHHFGFIGPDWQQAVAHHLDISLVSLRECLTFYHFFHEEPAGRFRFYVNDSITSVFGPHRKVVDTLRQAIGLAEDEDGPSGDGLFGLYRTACVGTSDQETGVLVNHLLFPGLNAQKAQQLVSVLGREAKKLPDNTSTDEIILRARSEICALHSGSDILRAPVQNEIHQKGVFLLRPEGPAEARQVLREVSSGLESADPPDYLGVLHDSGLRGRGGAGFPTAAKWKACRDFLRERRKTNPSVNGFIICNADEGEPGTFKDRTLLTFQAEEMFLGMALAARLTGARRGFVYLRYEYSYLLPGLVANLEQLRVENWLGESIQGVTGFDFDIEIRRGAGSYVCGEETALIESLEGKRGEPRTRPPYPVEKGFLDEPTAVNNVETYLKALQILHQGVDAWTQCGTAASTGTKMLSISGDCERPGLYEVEWGLTIREMLELCGGAGNCEYIVIGGAAGDILSASRAEDRRIAYEDVATGGSVYVFDRDRDLLTIVDNFLEFFVDETCGSCATCRIGTISLRDGARKIMAGQASERDLADLVRWGTTITENTRCGLGGTAPKPLTTALKSFPEEINRRLNQVAPFQLYESTRDFVDAHPEVDGGTT